jgi:hypothetical protein
MAIQVCVLGDPWRLNRVCDRGTEAAVGRFAQRVPVKFADRPSEEVFP